MAIGKTKVSSKLAQILIIISLKNIFAVDTAYIKEVK